ncbi:putative membrane protein [Peptoniphilus sp. ING2-D1G]|nr:putative membrane protein [Peptoniphilus sp. ING2-D1G]
MASMKLYLSTEFTSLHDDVVDHAARIGDDVREIAGGLIDDEVVLDQVVIGFFIKIFIVFFLKLGSHIGLE